MWNNNWHQTPYRKRGINKEICRFWIWHLNFLPHRLKPQRAIAGPSWMDYPPSLPQVWQHSHVCITLARGLMKVLFVRVWSSVINWQWASTVHQWFTVAMEATETKKKIKEAMRCLDAAILLQWKSCQCICFWKIKVGVDLLQRYHMPKT